MKYEEAKSNNTVDLNSLMDRLVNLEAQLKKANEEGMIARGTGTFAGLSALLLPD